MKIDKLDKQEKVFLAGCIKSMILADGKIVEEELIDLEKINKEINFTDFEETLEEFELNVKDEESFWDYAEKIKSETAKELILQTINELSLQKGYTQINELNLIKKLEKKWSGTM